MPIEKTEAIVLRVTPFSATSHVVNWLTADRGRLTTLIKGACRPKSAFLGQYDLHYTCELVYYGRENSGVPIARECVPLKTRSHLRSDWRASLCAGYSSGLATYGTMPGQSAPAVYDLLSTLLDFVTEHGARRTVMAWFELALLSALGVAPRLDSCALCGSATAPSMQSAVSLRHGGALCSGCRGRGDAGAVRPVSGSVVAMLSAWQRSPTPRAAHATACPEEAWLETVSVLGMFLGEYLGEAPLLRTRVAGLLTDNAPPTDAREEDV